MFVQLSQPLRLQLIGEEVEALRVSGYTTRTQTPVPSPQCRDASLLGFEHRGLGSED